MVAWLVTLSVSERDSLIYLRATFLLLYVVGYCFHTQFLFSPLRLAVSDYFVDMGSGMEVMTLLVFPLVLLRGAGAMMRLDLAVQFCLDRREMSVSLIPAFTVVFGMRARLILYIVQLEFGMDIAILTSAMIPTVTLGLDTAGGFRATLQLRMAMEIFRIVVIARLRFFFINMLSGEC